MIDIIGRIEANIDRESVPGCWKWTGYLVPKPGNPPRIAISGIHYFPAKVLWETIHGSAARYLKRTCQTHACVNPEHHRELGPRPIRAPYDPVAFFWAHVIQKDGCWEWTGPTDKGYGLMRTSKEYGVRSYASRFSYILHFGPIADDALVCHSCDNPPCCNPKHLFSGSHTDNRHDCVKKDRHAYGSKNGNSKLTAENVTEIRRAYAAKESDQPSLAERYGVTQVNISAILSRKTWKHLS